MNLVPITYQSRGQSFTGFLADGSRGQRVPGVLVIHEGGGLTGHAKERASRLAVLGYVAFAMDLFGLPEVDIERAKAIVQALRADVADLRARCVAALDVLKGHPSVDAAKLATIGFCFGGAAALELARSGADLACLVGFHAGVLPGTPEDNRAIRGRVLLCHGADDPVVPVAQIHAFAQEMTHAELDWQVHLYGGVGHSFTNREIDAWHIPGFSYHALADARSWAAMRSLMGETFGFP